MADDLSACELGCYGHPAHRTPHLDSLAAAGVRFRTAWSTPVCSPSRVQILTGRYGFRTGWFNYMGRAGNTSDHLDPDERTFADVLKASGYATGLAGKWQLGRIRHQPRMVFDSGFDEYCIWAWMQLPLGARFDGRPWKRRYWHPAVLVDGEHRPTGPDDYGPDLFTDWLIDFMRRHRERPFLAYYPMALIHPPWGPTPDPSVPGGRSAGGLASNVEHMDTLVGRLLATLDELGVRGRTVVLFTADNATAGSDKGRVTERGVSVPMIVSGPEHVEAGVVSDALVDLSDVLPTLAELAGVRLPEDVPIDGRSFAPILRGERARVREWIFSYLGYERMLRDQRWLLEGDGRFYDCRRAEHAPCREVSDPDSDDVRAARERFGRILEGLPGPGDPRRPTPRDPPPLE
jgi:arylsulfatase A